MVAIVLVVKEQYGVVVYTGGTFDLFHEGHVNLLRECQREGGNSPYVVVSLNTDEFVKQFKGQAPVMNYYERRAVLLACRYVDEVIPNVGGADSKAAINFAMPSKIVVGSDWAGKDYHAQLGVTPEWLHQKDILLTYVPYTTTISTTEIRKRFA